MKKIALILALVAFVGTATVSIAAVNSVKMEKKEGDDKKAKCGKSKACCSKKEACKKPEGDGSAAATTTAPAKQCCSKDAAAKKSCAPAKAE